MTDIGMKTVIALSKRFDDQLAVQLNAVGHVAQSVGHAARDLAVAEYVTATGQSLSALGYWPLIVLSGRAGKVQELWQWIAASALPRACFLETMIHGGSAVQLAATAALPGTDLPIVAVAVHGRADELDPLTRKLSLWRPVQRAL